jgi:hypothetical protein
MAERFQGFRSPNYTQVPDELFDELLSELSGAELKTLLYIIRRTFGFKRESDNISLSQMLGGIKTTDGRRLDNGAGLSKPTLLKSLRDLTTRNIIIPERRSSREKGNQPTNYRLNILHDANRTTPTGPSSNGSGGRKERRPPLVKELDQGVVKKLDQGLVKPFDHTRDSRQEREYVNVNALSEPQRPENEEKAEALVFEMLDVLGDRHSTGLYRRIARTVPDQLIFEVLAETKYQANTGRIRKNRGAFFTNEIMRRAKQAGINLGLR